MTGFGTAMVGTMLGTVETSFSVRSVEMLSFGEGLEGFRSKIPCPVERVVVKETSVSDRGEGCSLAICREVKASENCGLFWFCEVWAAILVLVRTCFSSESLPGRS